MNEFIFWVYYCGMLIVGLISFVAVLIYSIISWNLLIGFTVGWIPAVVAGFVCGFLWPLLIIIIPVLWYSGVKI